MVASTRGSCGAGDVIVQPRQLSEKAQAFFAEGVFDGRQPHVFSDHRRRCDAPAIGGECAAERSGFSRYHMVE